MKVSRLHRSNLIYMYWKSGRSVFQLIKFVILGFPGAVWYSFRNCSFKRHELFIKISVSFRGKYFRRCDMSRNEFLSREIRHETQKDQLSKLYSRNNLTYLHLFLLSWGRQIKILIKVDPSRATEWKMQIWFYWVQHLSRSPMTGLSIIQLFNYQL